MNAFIQYSEEVMRPEAHSSVVVQFGKEASRTRDCCVAKNATLRAARPDPSPRKERLLRMTSKLHHYPLLGAVDKT
jgi:hypothetical protein